MTLIYCGSFHHTHAGNETKQACSTTASMASMGLYKDRPMPLTKLNEISYFITTPEQNYTHFFYHN